MAGNYSGNRGGGTKDFKADPLKGFLMARSVALSYAKDLCVAGKIKLEQIPDYTDRMTVIQYGQVSVDQKVDAEIIRIAGRIKDRIEGKNKTAPVILCTTCTWGRNGSDSCCDGDPDFSYDLTFCEDYDDGSKEEGGDMDEHAANEKLREQEEQERQAAEDDAIDAEGQELPPNTQTHEGETTYTCGTCQKVYKTMKGLERHEKSVHSLPEDK